ncbi:Protein-associating with the carboxyl-terminal domain of ezrin [Eumeta japonica]|uniref:Protein-associating with the carboxyl-terminal domain of ezrin n=1 Tax=Eumeta variegata TaxID=151549 RepID=A0A4C1XTZ0_EUMVA|nr:Protein-associating with the carboxyl-terminal domain of ezrin [Eumeta japonica]
MGNVESQLRGLEIDEKPIEITDFWIQYRATINDSCRYFGLKCDGSVSLFKGETVLGPLWSVSSPLEKCSNAGMSHNNVSVTAIYVTGDGQWKLGGLQYLCPLKELTSAYLKHARIHRYDKAVDPNEESHDVVTAVDQYGFGVYPIPSQEAERALATPLELRVSINGDGIPYVREFKKYCREEMRHVNPAQRPKLSDALSHDFFNHKFILIYKFLSLLPLKSENEKQQFFTRIFDDLKSFDEETVAKQLGGLLLSRITMLDCTARTDLLLGVKDTDDNLVASTLICLSTLVPILGATTVIGGKRSKLFSDGRPNSKPSEVIKESIQEIKDNKTLKEFPCTEEICEDINFENIVMDERPSPVGGESVENELNPSVIVHQNTVISEDDWDDWDNTNKQTISIVPEELNKTVLDENNTSKSNNVLKENFNSRTAKLQIAALKAKKNILDIDELDIKTQKYDGTKKSEDIDFFADMMPVIEKTTVVSVPTIVNVTSDFGSKLNFIPNDTTDVKDGWGENWSD